MTLRISRKEDNIKIGKRLRKFRRNMGLSCTDFADRIKRNRSYLSGIENGHYPLSPRLVSLIETTFGIDARWILSDVLFMQIETQNEYENHAKARIDSDIREIPVVGETEAGLPSAILDDKLDSFFAAEKSIAVKNFIGEDLFALKVKGYSMSPRILPGDIVILSAARTPIPGSMCVAVNNNNESTLKIYEEAGNNVILKPLNPLNSVIVLRKDEVFRIYSVISILATSDFV
ncbi:MAG: XRE family transcriptional regulator [Planctomycetes bacterium]|nr:XRE family transcriptional regulator [Planctomycetota bacterium]